MPRDERRIVAAHGDPDTRALITDVLSEGEEGVHYQVTEAQDVDEIEAALAQDPKPDLLILGSLAQQSPLTLFRRWQQKNVQNESAQDTLIIVLATEPPSEANLSVYKQYNVHLIQGPLDIRFLRTEVSALLGSTSNQPTNV
jgi:DNA-binding response OmpR family regulator